MSVFLGIDIGTSSVKAVLLDADSRRLIGIGSAEYPTSHPQPGYAEQDPEIWWDAATTAIRAAHSAAAHVPVSAVGLSGQMHGTVLVDAAGAPVHPAVIWADERSRGAALSMTERVGAEAYAATAGTLPAAGFMGATLVWMREHAPEVLERAHAAILPKDYVRLRLTDEIASEVSDAASTGLFDIARRDWAWSLIDRFGLPRTLFSRLGASAAVAGFVTRQAAALTGLAPGIPVVYGCADQPAQALGSGLIAPGRGSVTIGSGGQVFAPLRSQPGERLRTDARLMVFNHAAPDMLYAEGAILAAGLALRWLRGIAGLEGDPNAYMILSAEAAQTRPGADGLLFLPYLMGERNPYLAARDGLPRSGFAGLTLAHGRGHLARAVMEGVAFALKDVFDAVQALTGPLRSAVAAGGGMDSPVWRGIMADVLGVPLIPALQPEQAGTGAALLAAVGVGYWKTLDQACADVVRLGVPTAPDPIRSAYYAGAYQEFLVQRHAC
ncbi:MAG: xylulokinase [bacterium]|nr:xylulokinase [bacterium]